MHSTEYHRKWRKKRKISSNPRRDERESKLYNEHHLMRRFDILSSEFISKKQISARRRRVNDLECSERREKRKRGFFTLLTMQMKTNFVVQVNKSVRNEFFLRSRRRTMMRSTYWNVRRSLTISVGSMWFFIASQREKKKIKKTFVLLIFKRNRRTPMASRTWGFFSNDEIQKKWKWFERFFLVLNRSKSTKKSFMFFVLKKIKKKLNDVILSSRWCHIDPILFESNEKEEKSRLQLNRDELFKKSSL